MDGEAPVNPYRPLAGDDDVRSPFAGRKAAWAHMYHKLTDESYRHGVAYMGRRGIGKSALLRHFGVMFDEVFVSVYVPLKQVTLVGDAKWLLELAQLTRRALSRRGFSLDRLPAAPDDSITMRGWLAGEYLPLVFKILRPHRRIVWLFDDTERLVDAVNDAAVPEDSVEFLHSLLRQYAQLQLVLTVSASREDELEALEPLVIPLDVFRLSNLTIEATGELLRQPVDGRYRVPDEVVTTIFGATGGDPQLVQRFGFHLFRQWEAGKAAATADDVKALIPAIYEQSRDDFRQMWEDMTENERLVLTAVVNCAYHNPLAPVEDERIESWLVETDYLLDRTAIKAAIRSLEYRETIYRQEAGVRVTSTLLQRWLLEHADLRRRPGPAASTVSRSRVIRAGIVALLLVVVILLVLITSSGTPPSGDDALPTVTLVPQE